MSRRRTLQARRSASRSLLAERLEDRRLLSGVETPYHNSMAPIDVTRDWMITPRDALVVINALNDGGSRDLDPSLASNEFDRVFIDTNGDNKLTPVDALLVINALNRGEGLDSVVGFRLELQDETGAAIEPVKDNDGNVILDGDGDPIYAVNVGDEFRVQIYINDLRSSVGANGGVFAAALDVGYNDPSLFSLGGTKPDAFTDLALFESYFKASSFYSQSGLSVYPSAMNMDGDGVANEYDELKTFAPTLTPFGVGEKPFVYVTMTADSVGKLTLAANQSDEDPPLGDILLFGEDDAVDVSVVDFGLPLHITIVQPVNAEDDAFTVAEDSGATMLNVLANDYLQSGSTGTLALDEAGLIQPANGVVAVVGSQIQYTPNADFFGIDTFVYRAIDGLGNSDTATVTVTVTSVNDPPVAVNDIITGIQEDSVNNVLDVLANDNGGPANEDQTLTIDPDTLTQPSHGTVTLINGNTQIQYTPVANYFGSDSFQYSVIDSDGLKSGMATVNIAIENVNDAPTVQNDQATGILEDSVDNVINVLANDKPGPIGVGDESSVDSLTIISVQDFSQGGSATISGDNILYTPAPDFFGTETFTYTVEDSGGLTATATVTVTVDNVNDPVEALDDVVFVDEMTADNPLMVLDNDSPGPANEVGLDDLVITDVTTPDLGGTVTIAADGKSILYTPDPEALGPYTETFEYTMTDGEFTDTATVTVNVEPVVRPRARDDKYTVNEDSSDNVLAVLVNDLFNEGATRTLFEIITPPMHGTAVIDGDSIVYTPAPDFFGTDTLEYRIDDDYVDEDEQESVPSTGVVTITVLGVNDPPVANDDTFTGILEDSVANPLDVLANDSILPDADEILTITKVGANVDGDDGQTAQGGTVTISGGKVLYTPAPDFFGTDTFFYTITDGNGGFATATVTVEVDNVNDDPTANPDAFDVLEDSVDHELDVLANDSIAPDVGETLTIISVGANAASNDGLTAQGGTVTISGDKVLYTPPADFFGTDSFTYIISDGNGGTSKATVTLTVHDVNDDPTAVDDHLMALKDFTNQELDVLANDSIAPDVNETLTISGLGPANETTLDTPHGTATISADGKKIIYTPDPGFETVGDDFDTFTYTISDGRGGTAVGNVVVDVIDAVPSDISGVVYLDVNNNGIRDPQEVKLAGVEVTLTGTNVRGVPLNITVKTDVNGVFLFENILPNAEGDTVGYTITSATAKFLIDGKDSIVDPATGDDLNPGTAGDDVFTGIDLGLWGTERSVGNYLFGERGLQSKYITIAQYLSSTRKGLALATNMQGEDYWFTLLQGWEGVRTAHAQLASDLASCQLTIVDVNGQTHTRTINYKHYHVAGDRTTGEYMIYFNGSAADLGFHLAAVQNGEAGAEGEAVEMYDADFAQGADEVFAADAWA
ncbi:MAG: tandem-95 repeat protein [Planctomycetaceae bacterium]|nr:tandem-95 repeat protein [Planctomycetaceae bacterium]